MKILFNARIMARAGGPVTATAIAIEQGRVVAVGSDQYILDHYGYAQEKRDLRGRFVLPGLTDTHVHFLKYAQTLQKVDCETATLAECLSNVRSRVAATPPGEWVLGHGWNQNEWPDCQDGFEGFPKASTLDAISTSHPIYLTAKSLHAGLANSLALQLAGIGDAAPDPPNGELQRDSTGVITGILLEGAMGLVSRAIPEPSDEENISAMIAAQKALWALGITGLHDFDRRRCFIALKILHGRGDLKLRIVKSIPVEDLEHAVALGLRSGFGDEMLRIGNIKIFADGALGPHTAAMIAPYDDQPGNTGMLLKDREEIYEHGKLAVENGFGLTIHAIGDRANHEVLAAYDGLRKLEGEQGLPHFRHRIEHVQVLHSEDLGRLAELDVIASMQPIHVASDMVAADRCWGKRTEYAYAWRTMLDTGAVLAFGSDAPVESPNPWWGIHTAITRERPGSEYSAGGWHPEQRLTRKEALEAYTTGPAFTAGMEDRLGKLESGYHADLIVLEEDPLECNLETLRELSPVRTMVGGEWVWGRE